MSAGLLCVLALVQIVQKSKTGPNSGALQVLLLAPLPVAIGREASALTGFAEMFEGTEARSRRFAEHYACVAQERGCAFLDTGQVIVSSDLDGIHLEASEQKKLGVAVAARVRELLG